MSVTFYEFPTNVLGEINGYEFEAILSSKVDERSFFTEKYPDGTHVIKFWLRESDGSMQHFEFWEGTYEGPDPDEDALGVWDMVREVVDVIEDRFDSAPTV